MKEVRINDLELLKYLQVSIYGSVSEGVDDIFPNDRYACFGEFRSDGQAMWAVSVYDFKRNHDCTLDVALNLDGLFSRGLFEKIARVVCDYTFKQTNLLRMTTYVRVSNQRSRRITKGWGFREEGLIRLGFGPPLPEDMYVFGMTYDECKWI